MLCGVCHVENPENANFCVRCGSAFGVPHTVITEAPAPFYYSLSPAKVYLMSSLSFGLYSVFWFWSQFRAEDPNEGRGWALFRTLLSGVFFYGMAREVQEEASRREAKVWCPPAILTAVLWLAIAVRMLPEPSNLPAFWVIPVPVTICQVAINRVNHAVAQRNPTGWRWWEITIAVVLGVFWCLGAAGFILHGVSPQLSDNA